MTYALRQWHSRDGLTLSAYDYAAADGLSRLPVICVHGLTRNGRDFSIFAPWLAAQGRRVIAIDVRGRGLSDRDPAALYHLPIYAEDVIALMMALGIARAHFVGTSMGGLITMELAGMRPDLIAGAVINDVGPELAVAGLTRIAGYVGNSPRYADWAAAEAYLQKINGEALPHYGPADWTAMAHRLFREEDGTIAPDYDPAIAGAFATAPVATDPWLQWRALTSDRPVLLLRGALSDLLDEDIAGRMREAAPGIDYAVIPDVGHAPMLDEPEAKAAIERFFNRLDPSGRSSSSARRAVSSGQSPFDRLFTIGSIALIDPAGQHFQPAVDIQPLLTRIDEAGFDLPRRARDEEQGQQIQKDRGQIDPGQ